MNNTTYSVKKSEIERKWYVIDAANIGGMKELTAREMMNKSPEKVMTHAVVGMLPHNSLGRQMAKKLRVYAGSEHEQIAQKPEVWEVK